MHASNFDGVMSYYLFALLQYYYCQIYQYDVTQLDRGSTRCFVCSPGHLAGYLELKQNEAYADARQGRDPSKEQRVGCWHGMVTLHDMRCRGRDA